MPSENEEQKKNGNDEFVDVVDGPEDLEDKQAAEDNDEIPSGVSAHDTEGKLGDEEEVMPDSEPPKQPGRFKRFFIGYWHKKKWTLPVTVLALVAITFAVPTTRYPLLALGVKRSYDVTIVDSKTNTPVSGAQVMLDGKTATTDSKGNATLTAKVGKRTLKITKQYYKDFSENIFVGVSSGHNTTNVQLDATGRQVPIIVVNKITGKPVANAEVKVLDTEAKTDTDGKATIVLPTGSPTQSTTVTANGYNNLTTNVQVTSRVVSANTFAITPSGRVYFLSNLSGNIDVVSTNLDGTDRKTVLAGTGSEDNNNTVLLASRDWQYLALLSKRDGGQDAKLFLINTSNNQVTTMDEGNAVFTPVGWDDHYFVYRVSRNDVNDWQSGQTALKSYDADTGKIAVIDQTEADGTQNNYEYQTLSFVNLVNNRVVYGLSWGAVLRTIDPSKRNSVMSADASGANKSDIKDIAIPANTGWTYMYALLTKPGTLDIQSSTGANNVYYSYNYQNNTVTQSNTITDNTFNQVQQNYVTYLVSPSGSQTFWSQQRDGKNTLFVGDYYGNNGQQIASLSDYQTYGWYTDKYLLVEKSGSELYVMPVGGGTALKISDYYKPPRNFYGYGGGYGGL